MSFFSKSNAFIKNGKIQNTNIAMNDKVISSHGTPIDVKDVVNKTYCDNNTSTVTPIATFILLEDNWKEVLSVKKGDVSISIFSLVDNGPCGSFHLTKNNILGHPSLVRISSVAGSITQERLEARWRPNTGIEVRKNGILYNGEYRLKYLLN